LLSLVTGAKLLFRRQGISGKSSTREVAKRETRACNVDVGRSAKQVQGTGR